MNISRAESSLGAFIQRQLPVNRAPVLMLWAAVVAEVLGFDHDEALTLGQAVAGLNARSKGVSLSLFQPIPKREKEQRRKMPKEETFLQNLSDSAAFFPKSAPIPPLSLSNSLSTKSWLIHNEGGFFRAGFS